MSLIRISVRPQAVSCVVFRHHPKQGYQQLLVKRCPADGDFWSHIGGGIESGETAVTAIIRELKEETGLTAEVLYNAEYIEQFYQLEQDRILSMPLFVVRVLPDSQVQLNDEHTDFRWCSLAEAVELVPFQGQKKVYQYVWPVFANDNPMDRYRIVL